MVRGSSGFGAGGVDGSRAQVAVPRQGERDVANRAGRGCLAGGQSRKAEFISETKTITHRSF